MIEMETPIGSNRTVTQVKVECPSCGGDGQQWADGSCTFPGPFSCDTCQGKGWLWKEI